MNILNDICEKERNSGLFIGRLILEELKCIRSELKEEVRRLSDKFQDFIDAKNNFESKAASFVEFEANLKYMQSKVDAIEGRHKIQEFGFKQLENCDTKEKESCPGTIIDVSECLEDIEIPRMSSLKNTSQSNLLPSFSDFSLEVSGCVDVKSSQEDVEESSSHIIISSIESQNAKKEPTSGRKPRKSRPHKHILYAPSYSHEDDTKSISTLDHQSDVDANLDLNHDNAASPSIDLDDWRKYVAVYKKKAKCKICGQRFTRPSSVKRHLVVHKKEQTSQCLTCGTCGKTFLSSTAFKSHMLKFHGNVPQNLVQNCKSSINRTEKSSAKLNQAVSLDIPFASPDASQKEEFMGETLPSSSLKTAKVDVKPRHPSKRKRSKNQPIPENYVVIPDHVINSLIERNGRKFYQCNVCDKMFVYTSQSYRRHMMIHTGERPFKCEFCSRAFIRSTNLRMHLRTHTDEKKYQCHICISSFSVQSILTTHLRACHGYIQDVA